MTIFVTLAVTVLAFAVIVYPFFKRRSEDEEVWGVDAATEAPAASLMDLEVDLESGSLDAEEYREQETRQTGLPSAPARGNIRADTGMTMETRIEKRVSELRRRQIAFCPQCGKKVRETDRFCSSCGNDLYGG